MSRTALSSLVIVAAAVAGCGPGAYTPDTPYMPGTRVVDETPVVKATVPKGTHFAIELDRALDPDALSYGDEVRANLMTPLVAADGRTVAPKGSVLVGRVVLAEPDTRTIGVRFDNVQTLFGTYPIDAEIVDAGHWAMTIRTTPEDEDEQVAALRGRPSAFGGGPPASPDLAPSAPSEGPVVPNGAILGLVLVKPFEAPPVGWER